MKYGNRKTRSKTVGKGQARASRNQRNLMKQIGSAKCSMKGALNDRRQVYVSSL